jgi:uncharacterized protein DUF4382
MSCLKRVNIGRAAAAVAIVLSGCSGGGGGSSDGSLSVAVMDAPVDGVAHVYLQFTGFSLKPQGNGPAIDINLSAPVTVDLLSLTADNTKTLLASHSVPAGAYNWLDLHVNATLDGTLDSYVVLQTGGTVELEVPSGELRLVSGLTITADQETSFLIDWDLHQGLTNPVGQAGMFLRPALRVIDMTQYGTLKGTVATTQVMAAGCTGDVNLDTGNAVYIYSGLNVTPDDIDGTAPDPVATAAVKLSSTGTYSYKTILSPGDYTVAFTCQAKNDDPTTNDQIAFVHPTNVSIVNGQTVSADFQ